MGKIARRDFLKATPAAVSAAAYVAAVNASTPDRVDRQARPSPQSADPAISATAYTPVGDYPIQPKRYSDVRITDSFWKPEIAINAAVTIPFEVRNQSYRPVLEQSEAVGHAVNCVSLMASLTDVGVLTGIKDYFDAAHRMWLDVVERKMYITGGVGIGDDKDFPRRVRAIRSI